MKTIDLIYEYLRTRSLGSWFKRTTHQCVGPSIQIGARALIYLNGETLAVYDRRTDQRHFKALADPDSFPWLAETVTKILNDKSLDVSPYWLARRLWK